MCAGHVGRSVPRAAPDGRQRPDGDEGHRRPLQADGTAGHAGGAPRARAAAASEEGLGVGERKARAAAASEGGCNGGAASEEWAGRDGSGRGSAGANDRARR
eukprot:5790650-Prymnesium_polylepis.1